MRVEKRLLPPGVASQAAAGNRIPVKQRPIQPLGSLPVCPEASLHSLSLGQSGPVTVRHGLALFYNSGPDPIALASAADKYLQGKGEQVDQIEILYGDLLAIITRHDPLTDEARRVLMIPERLLASDVGLYGKKPTRARFTQAELYEGQPVLSLQRFSNALLGLKNDTKAEITPRRLRVYFMHHGLEKDAPGKFFKFEEMGNLMGCTHENCRQIIFATERIVKQHLRRFWPAWKLVTQVLDRLLADRVCLTKPEIEQALIESGLAAVEDRAFILPMFMLLGSLFSNEYCLINQKGMTIWSFSHRNMAGALTKHLAGSVLFKTAQTYRTLEKHLFDLPDQLKQRCWKKTDLQKRLAQDLGIWAPESRLELICRSCGYVLTADGYFVFGRWDRQSLYRERITLLIKHHGPVTAKEAARQLGLSLGQARDALSDKTRFRLEHNGRNFRYHLA